MSRKFIADDQDLYDLRPVVVLLHPRRSMAVALPVAAFCGLILAAVSVAVEAGLVSGTDRYLELLVHADATAQLYGPMAALSFIGESGSIAVLAFACVVSSLRSGGRWTAAFIAACPTGAGILDSILKVLFHRHRPHLWPHAAMINSYSFPSGHATISAAFFAGLVYAAWSLYGPRTGTLTGCICTAMVAGIGFSRVYLGVHWPSDVLAGYALGLSWVFLLVGVFGSVRGPTTSASHETRQIAARDRVKPQVQ